MEIIQQLITRKGPGHLFRPAHFFIALQVIEEKGPIGRYELGRILDLGGGSIRTLVNRMKDADLIAVEGKKGHILTERGKNVLIDIKKNLIAIQKLDLVEKLTNAKFNWGFQVRAISDKIGSGISLRDAAISVGANSITSLIYTEKGFNIPTFDEDYLDKEYPDLSKLILKLFNFQMGDVLVICGADSEIIAKLGGITAVLSLLNS